MDELGLTDKFPATLDDLHRDLSTNTSRIFGIDVSSHNPPNEEPDQVEERFVRDADFLFINRSLMELQSNIKQHTTGGPYQYESNASEFVSTLLFAHYEAIFDS